MVGNMKGVNPHAKIIVTQNSKVDLKEVLNKWDNDEDGDSKECMQGAELEFFTDRIESPDVLPALEQLMDEVLGDCDEACATIEKMKKKVGA